MRTSVKLISSITLCMSVIGGSQVVKAFQGDKRAEDQIRKALADWVTATNRRDEVRIPSGVRM